MGAFTQQTTDPTMALLLASAEPDSGIRKQLVSAYKDQATKTSLSPLGSLGVAGLSGGLGALGQVLASNQQADRQKELLQMQAQQRAISPDQRVGLEQLAARFSRRPDAQPFTAQTSLGPGQGAQSAGDLERRLAEMRQRLSAIRK